MIYVAASPSAPTPSAPHRFVEADFRTRTTTRIGYRVSPCWKHWPCLQMSAPSPFKTRNTRPVCVVRCTAKHGDGRSDIGVATFKLSDSDSEAELEIGAAGKSNAVVRNSTLINEMASDDLGELKQQLEDLRDKISQLIEEGQEGVARALIDANYLALLDQLDSGVQGIEQAALLDILAQCHMDMGDSKGAEHLLEQLNDIMEQHFSPQPLADKIFEHMGTMYAALEKPDRALKFYNKCLELQEDLFGNDSPFLAKALLGSADAHGDLENSGMRNELYYRVLTIVEKSKGPDHETLVLLLSRLGHVLLEEGKVVEAEHFLNRALKIMKNTCQRAQDGNVGVIMSALARAKRAGGDMEASVVLFRGALKIMERCSEFSSDDSVVERTRTDFAAVLTVMKRHEEAQELLEDNLHVKQSTLGPSDPELLVHLKNLAISYANSGKLAKCESLMRKCLKLATNHFGPNAPQLSGPLELLATLLHHMGKDTEAQALARQCLLLCETAFGKPHPFTGDACNCLAAISYSLGLYEESEALMSRVLKIQEDELGPNDPLVGSTLQRLIVLNRKLGRDTAPLVQRVERLMKSAALSEEAEEDVPDSAY